MSILLSLPRELREEILHYLTLPGMVYTSNAETYSQLPASRKPGRAYIDSRIYMPCHPPANLLATCRQLRQECLEHRFHLLNSPRAVEVEETSTEMDSNTAIFKKPGTDLDEAAERAGDDGVTPRLTLEVQRAQRNPFGFSIPVREEFSPRLLALLPLMRTVRKLRLVVWPGFDWWNGPPQVSPLEQWRQRRALLKRVAHQVGHTASPSEAEPANTNDPAAIKLDAVSVAVGKILDQLPAVEELDLGIFIVTGDLFRWDLPDVKWEKIQPWLDGPITRSGGLRLCKVSRTLTSVWQKPEGNKVSQQPFYVQKETRSDILNNKWHIERHGGWRAAALELPETIVDETFERVDS
ncbi:uncharacterized protein EKO05_0007040 [Ascochyta rabiei]|uniref:Uncharacterized protein n=1 Tax=Didymella rabiei TaxID=5454 RepID=A0A162Z0V7_DIDRA|nr:uncharacterized protein EKO05_0007040 [Ascochyta rabiei]KZM20338.1 hypothetical protein ST47_g8398 [Ascochyta rabiei]UPX16650.1 hypothetical protein EKO05_0007040 [Ascochyta rabiei]